MTWLWVVVVGPVALVGLALAARALLRAAEERPLICGICGGPIEELEPWRLCRHMDAPLHYSCIPAWLRAAGPAYVSLWLEQGDAMRLLDHVERADRTA